MALVLATPPSAAGDPGRTPPGKAGGQAAGQTGTPAAQSRPNSSELPDQAAAAAQDALAEVEAIVEGTGPAAEEPAAGESDETGEPSEPGAPDLSLALRDLALGLDDLQGADRRAAQRFLARPTSWYEGDPISYEPGHDLRSVCGLRVCVHRVTTGLDAPPSRDTDADGVPDQVQLTLDTFEDVWVRTAAMGYREPLPDDIDVADPDARPRFDVYLADLGSLAVPLFGYCAWESKKGFDYAASGYCVVDNDFAARQFKADPVRSLRETVAHEFFHAVQFGYDAVDDVWFMESTATWMEDQLFDAADGNREFLDEGQLYRPNTPLDDPRGRYGNWVFIQWLSERFGPAIVLQAWRQADSVGPAVDSWGLQAIDRALRSRGSSLSGVLARYAVDLRFATDTFDEGDQGLPWRDARSAKKIRLSRRAPVSGLTRLRVRQTGSTSVVAPTSRRTAAMRRLAVVVDGPDRARGVRVKVVQVRRDGRRVVSPVKVDRLGRGTARVGFARRGVKRVVVVATGTSYRMACWEGTALSCEGRRADDRLPLTIRLAGR